MDIDVCSITKELLTIEGAIKCHQKTLMSSFEYVLSIGF
jgi:hypothetical protein